MGHYICAIFIALLPIACFFYYLYIACIAYDDNGEKLIKEIQSPTYFMSSIFTIAISLMTCFCFANEIIGVQKNVDTPYTYYTEAKVVVKDTITVFKVNVNDKDYYYETDISVKNNILDYFVNNSNNTEYVLLMSDNTTRDDKSDDTILKIYYTNTNGGN